MFGNDVDRISGCMLSPSNFLSIGRKDKTHFPILNISSKALDSWQTFKRVFRSEISDII